VFISRWLPARLRILRVREHRKTANRRSVVAEECVSVRAAAQFNPSDPKSVLGKISETKTPRVPGRDVAGIVVEGQRPERQRGCWHRLETGGLGEGSLQSFGITCRWRLDLRKKPGAQFPEQRCCFRPGYLTAWSEFPPHAPLADGVACQGRCSACSTEGHPSPILRGSTRAQRVI